MRKPMRKQQDLFEETGNDDQMSEELKGEGVRQLALLIQSVIDPAKREVRDDEDPR